MNIAETVRNVRSAAESLSRPLVFMEVCGTHTVSAFRTGLRSLLPDNVSLLSGPGCPVCVTPTGYLDQAIAIGRQPGTVIATFGDMLRVPGTESALEKERARGTDVRIVYSPMDALKMAQAEPDKSVVFLGVGFETTTPTIAWTIKEAAEKLSRYQIEYRILPRDGSEKWVLGKGHAEYNEAEKPVRLIGTIQDITEINLLRGILPICSFCKKIRDDKGYWDQVEVYVAKHSDVLFSHSFCPECVDKHYPEFPENWEDK